jgi:gamma-glutamyl:cysteine ligase YbdK (ATP-grasp superfamily)
MSTDYKAAAGSWNAAELWRSWMQLAPSNLVQPIMSGWTLNINSQNSSAPQTEASVVARHSYGRQLGRIADVVRVLVDDCSPAARQQAVAAFLSMCREIDEVKTDAASKRLNTIAADLALLKEKDPKDYAQVREALTLALKLTR